MVSEYEDQPLLSSSDSIVLEGPSSSADANRTLLGSIDSRAQIEQSLLKKLDRRMSVLVLIYILNYMDRNNAASVFFAISSSPLLSDFKLNLPLRAARLRGFEQDLHLEGNQFGSILSVLYVGYILMQIPSNMLLVYVGKPSIYLPVCMVVWGGISALTGLTTNFFGALCTRFFLGFVEAAFFPGALFLISRWYRKDELSQRTAYLYCGSIISNAFGALIASGILDTMDGVLGFVAWRWLFFIEGFLTIVVAIFAMFFLPDFPENPCAWLTTAERELALQRIRDDVGVHDTVQRTRPAVLMPSPLENAKCSIASVDRGLQLALTDWKVWWLAFTIGNMTVSLSFNAFFPTLAATMGYNATTTLLLCSPPWIFSAIVTIFVSRHSDRTKERFGHILVPFVIATLGFLIATSTMSIGFRYLSLFLMAQAYAGYACFLAWASGTISQPSSKRAVALAFINCGGTMGNIAGSYIWPSIWAPTYSHSFSICILCISVAIFMCYMFRIQLKLLNRDVELKGIGPKYIL